MSCRFPGYSPIVEDPARLCLQLWLLHAMTRLVLGGGTCLKAELIFGWVPNTCSAEGRDLSLEAKAEGSWSLQPLSRVGNVGWILSRLQKGQKSHPKLSLRHPGAFPS